MDKRVIKTYWLLYVEAISIPVEHKRFGEGGCFVAEYAWIREQIPGLPDNAVTSVGYDDITIILPDRYTAMECVGRLNSILPRASKEWIEIDDENCKHNAYALQHEGDYDLVLKDEDSDICDREVLDCIN